MQGVNDAHGVLCMKRSRFFMMIHQKCCRLPPFSLLIQRFIIKGSMLEVVQMVSAKFREASRQVS